MHIFITIGLLNIVAAAVVLGATFFDWSPNSACRTYGQAEVKPNDTFISKSKQANHGQAVMLCSIISYTKS